MNSVNARHHDGEHEGSGEGDQRLTAYALGESLGADERASVEALLTDDPAAAREVEHIRRCAHVVEDAMRSESSYALTAEQRARIEEALEDKVETTHVVETRQVIFRLPRAAWYTAGGLALAAVLALAFVVPMIVDDRGSNDFASDVRGFNRPAPAEKEAAEGLDDAREGLQSGTFDDRASRGESEALRSEPDTALRRTNEENMQARARDAGAAPPKRGEGASTVPPAPAGGGGGGGGDAQDAPGRMRDELVHSAPEAAGHAEAIERRIEAVVDGGGIDGMRRSIIPMAASPASVRETAAAAAARERPAAESVHVIDLINYFQSGDVGEDALKDAELLVQIESAAAPWKAGHVLVRIAVTNATDVPIPNPHLVVAFERAVESWEVIGTRGQRADEADPAEETVPWDLQPSERFVSLLELALEDDDERAEAGTTIRVRIEQTGDGGQLVPVTQESAAATPGGSIRNASKDFRMTLLAAAAGLTLRNDPRIDSSFLDQAPDILSDVLPADLDPASREAELISFIYNVRKLDRGPSPSGGG